MPDDKDRRQEIINKHARNLFAELNAKFKAEPLTIMTIVTLDDGVMAYSLNVSDCFEGAEVEVEREAVLVAIELLEELEAGMGEQEEEQEERGEEEEEEGEAQAEKHEEPPEPSEEPKEPKES